MTQDTSLSALLDYYSDKASASATLVVATIFGLFTVLSLSQTSATQNVPNPNMFLVYWVLCGAGLYFLMSFRFWALNATLVKAVMMKRTRSKPLRPGEYMDREIENSVKMKWKETPLRSFFVWSKERPKLSLKVFQQTIRRWFSTPEKPWLARLGNFLPMFFLGFGLIVSIIFFREWWHTVVYFFIFSVLVLDFISVILQHRRRWFFALCSWVCLQLLSYYGWT